MSILGSLSASAGLLHYDFCLTCVRGLLWLHAGADALILLSYLSIPVSLIWLLRRRQDRAYRWVGYVIVSFIFAGAATHALAILTLWLPVYGIEGVAKALTAIGSLTIASVLWIMAPRIAAIKSTAQLTAANEELSHLIAEREAKVQDLQATEERLRSSNAALESVVSEYAAELRSAGTQMHRIFRERLEIQEQLTRREEEHQASFDTAAVGKVQIEPPSGRLLRVNDAFAAMLGYQAADLVGRDIWDLTYPDDRPAARARFDQLLAREVDQWVMEKRFVRRDGTAVWVRISASVVIDPAIGLPRLALADIEDLDLRHDIQSALRATDARLRLALESMHFGVVEVDIRNGLFWANARSSAMSGGDIPAETWLGLNSAPHAAWIRRIHPDDRDEREVRLRALFAGTAAMVQIPLRVRGNDGGWSSLVQRYAVVERDPATAEPVRAVGIITDVTAEVLALTEAQAARGSLERSLARHKAALAHRHLLLRGVYHCMDDALQSLDRFLAATAQRIAEPETRHTLSALRSRITTIGFVHGELMAQPDIDTFDFAAFLRDLCDALLGTESHRAVRLHLDAARLEISLDHAVPLGLLTSELLMQCLDYARQAGDHRIDVGLHSSKEAAMVMTMFAASAAPAGGGPEAAGITGPRARLVRALLMQIGARLELAEAGGLRAEVTIPHPAV